MEIVLAFRFGALFRQGSAQSLNFLLDFKSLV